MRVFCHSKVIPSQNDLEWPRWGMRSEISFDHHSFQNDPGMTVFCHSDLILSFETKDERNEVDKVPFREANTHKLGWILSFSKQGLTPRLILEIIWHFFLKNHPQNTPKMHCEEVLDRNMWLLASLSSVVLSTQPSHFAIDLRCYIHTGLLCSDLFKINHYKSYLEGNIGFFQLR